MPKPKVTLILGAGFSCEASLPTTPELSNQFLAVPENGTLPHAVEGEISKHLGKFWEKVFGYSGENRPSLEDHFTVIDLAANTGHHLGPFYSPRKLRAIRRFSIHRVFQILDSKYRASETITSLLTILSQATDLTIISTNWGRSRGKSSE